MSTLFNSVRNLLGCSVLSVLAVASAQAADATACKTVRMGLVSWTDVMATSGIAQVLFQQLGYDVKQTTASQQIIMSGIRNGRSLDVFLGYWQPLMEPVVQPYLDAGTAKVLPQPSLTDARTALAVPTYLYERGLKTFSDISRFEKELGGKIYGIEPGVESNNKIRTMIETNKFGLRNFTLVEAGEMGIMTALKRAVSRQEDILFFGWMPHPMSVHFDISFLSGSDDVFAANDGKAIVSTLLAPDYQAQCPNATRLLENLKFTAAEVSELMVPIMDRVAPDAVAEKWLRENPQRRATWLEGVTNFDGSSL